VPWLQDVWTTRHIPPFIPAPPFIGDLPALAVKGMHVVFGERAKKYASYPAFRVFVGSRVWVVTADPESGRRLMTRLLNRTRFVQIAEDETALGGGRDLATLRGERWRRMRLAWLPTFSPPSLARYAPLMDGCAKRLADRLEPWGASGGAVDVWRLIGALTLDVVGTTAFGTRFNALAADGERADAGEGDDADAIDGKRLVDAARTIFARGSLTTGSGYQALAIMFPLGTPLWKRLAKRFPDHNLRELNEARRVVSDAGVALLKRQRRRDEAAKTEAAAEGAKDDADAANGHDQQQNGGSKAPSAVSKGILPGSFLAQLLKPAPAPRGGSGEAQPPPPPPQLEDADAIA
jgi:thromboxane-A synthase/cytochrome P450 family 3 subfamily A